MHASSGTSAGEQLGRYPAAARFRTTKTHSRHLSCLPAQIILGQGRCFALRGRYTLDCEQGVARWRRLMSNFTRRLAHLRESKCEAVHAIEYEERAGDTIYLVATSIEFTDGTKLDAQFWRLTKGERPLVSIFDHRQRYGLPAPIDAFRVMRDELVGKQVSDVVMDKATGDLRFRFKGDVVLEVFNFTAFEIWKLIFPDGTMELSNFALDPEPVQFRPQ